MDEKEEENANGGYANIFAVGMIIVFGICVFGTGALVGAILADKNEATAYDAGTSLGIKGCAVDLYCTADWVRTGALEPPPDCYG